MKLTKEQIDTFQQKLAAMDNRLSEDIEVMSDEIDEAGIVVGEHTSRSRESIETELILEKNEEAIQHDVRAALLRIESGNFGTCEDCGQAIAFARLEAIPYTPICIDCERKRESSQ